MIRPRLLLALLGDPVSFDPSGDPAGLPVGGGSAVIVVAPVTDALKQVEDGVITGPIDREAVRSAVSFAVSREILERLGDGAFEPAGFIEAVRSLGVEWVLAPQDEALRPFSAQ